MLLAELTWGSTMDRWCRHLIVLTVLLTLVTACAGPAAPPATPRTYRIGYFGAGGNPKGAPLPAVLLEEMSRLGYVVDQNLTIEYRYADGKLERLPGLAQELATLRLDAVFASSELSAQAMLEADADVPIVFVT